MDKNPLPLQGTAGLIRGPEGFHMLASKPMQIGEDPAQPKIDKFKKKFFLRLEKRIRLYWHRAGT